MAEQNQEARNSCRRASGSFSYEKLRSQHDILTLSPTFTHIRAPVRDRMQCQPYNIQAHAQHEAKRPSTC